MNALARLREDVIRHIVATDDAADAPAIADAILALFEPKRLRVLPPRMPHIPPPDPVERDLADLDALLPLAQATLAVRDVAGGYWNLLDAVDVFRFKHPALAARLRKGA